MVRAIAGTHWITPINPEAPDIQATSKLIQKQFDRLDVLDENIRKARDYFRTADQVNEIYHMDYRNRVRQSEEVMVERKKRQGFITSTSAFLAIIGLIPFILALHEKFVASPKKKQLNRKHARDWVHKMTIPLYTSENTTRIVGY